MLQECKRSKTQSSLQLRVVGDFGGCYWAFAAVLHWEGNMRTIWGVRRTFVRNLCEHPHSTFHLPKLSSTFGAIKGNPGFKSRNQIFLFLLPQWFLQLNQFAKKTRGAVGRADPSAAFIITLVLHLFDFSPLCAKKNRVRTNKAICSLVSPLLDRIPYSRHCGRRHLAPAPPPWATTLLQSHSASSEA